MTTIHLRSILLALFCLLAFAASASAECAWVLWEEHDARFPGKEISQWWRIGDAYESRLECSKDRRESIDRFRAQPKKEGIDYEVQGAFTMITWFLDDVGGRTRGSRAIKLWCLPSGTDPRPRYKE